MKGKNERIDEKLAQELEEIRRERVRRKIDNEMKSIRRLTLAIRRHRYFPEIKKDLLNAEMVD